MAHKKDEDAFSDELVLEHLRVLLGVTNNRELLRRIQKMQGIESAARSSSRDLSDALSRYDAAATEKKQELERCQKGWQKIGSGEYTNCSQAGIATVDFCNYCWQQLESQRRAR